MKAVSASDIIENIDFMPVEIKTTLVEKLLESLHGSSSSIEKSWIEECDKRAVDSAELIDGKTVFQTIRNKYS
jgi:hypothetical protein